MTPVALKCPVQRKLHGTERCLVYRLRLAKPVLRGALHKLGGSWVSAGSDGW